jgi:hypothetical protein
MRRWGSSRTRKKGKTEVMEKKGKQHKRRNTTSNHLSSD